MRTRGFIALVLLQAQDGLTDSALGGSVIALVARSGALSRAVLLILILFSIASWGIVLHKLWQYRLAKNHTVQFRNVFRRSSKFSEVQSACESLSRSPLVGVFQTGYAE